MKLLNKVVSLAANRFSLDRRAERDSFETVLQRLSEIAYWRLREKGFEPGGIIDIGAHEGNWTRMIRRVYPASPILMIEARQEQEAALKQICSSGAGISYIISLLGRESAASVPFNVSSTGSSIFAERSDAPRSLHHLPMRTLDEVLFKTQPLVEPLLLKLDVQGAELECLRGGSAALVKAEIVQLEVALLNYNEGAPQVAEVVAFMDAQGFTMLDIAGFVRPNGTDLVQIDIVFAKKTSRLRPDFFRFRTSKAL